MSFRRNPLIPTWNCGKGKHLKAKSKEKVKDISRFLSERLIEPASFCPHYPPEPFGSNVGKKIVLLKCSEAGIWAKTGLLKCSEGVSAKKQRF